MLRSGRGGVPRKRRWRGRCCSRGPKRGRRVRVRRVCHACSGGELPASLCHLNPVIFRVRRTRQRRGMLRCPRGMANAAVEATDLRFPWFHGLVRVEFTHLLVYPIRINTLHISTQRGITRFVFPSSVCSLCDRVKKPASARLVRDAWSARLVVRRRDATDQHRGRPCEDRFVHAAQARTRQRVPVHGGV
jgi:hypothetical protein